MILRTDVAVYLCRAAVWLENRRVPLLPRLLALSNGAWICKATGRHAMVRCIPMCWRCFDEWPSWDESPGPRLREGVRS